MRRYLARRLLQAVVVLWAAYTISFIVLYLLPSDPVSIMASGGQGEQNSVPAAQLAALRHQYGFDKPVIVQYVDQLGRVLHGDLGRSVQTGQTVRSMIADALPQTLQLAGFALLLAILAGVGLAFGATFTRRRWLREVLLALPPVGVSLPSFWVGLMLVELLSFHWRLLPALGNSGFRALILPAVTMAIPTAAVIAQLLAKSLDRTLAEPYVEVARAKGLAPIAIHLRHAVRNALLPALTVAGMVIGHLFAGSVVVETVFSRNGVGRITATAVEFQDIPVVQGVVVLGAVAFVAVNLAVDLLYPLLDPRIVAIPAAAR
jgi:peptide/nickel transport system permease protein